MSQQGTDAKGTPSGVTSYKKLTTNKDGYQALRAYNDHVLTKGEVVTSIATSDLHKQGEVYEQSTFFQLEAGVDTSVLLADDEGVFPVRTPSGRWGMLVVDGVHGMKPSLYPTFFDLVQNSYLPLASKYEAIFSATPDEQMPKAIQALAEEIETLRHNADGDIAFTLSFAVPYTNQAGKACYAGFGIGDTGIVLQKPNGDTEQLAHRQQALIEVTTNAGVKGKENIKDLFADFPSKIPDTPGKPENPTDFHSKISHEGMQKVLARNSVFYNVESQPGSTLVGYTSVMPELETALPGADVQDVFHVAGTFNPQAPAQFTKTCTITKYALDAKKLRAGAEAERETKTSPATDGNFLQQVWQKNQAVCAEQVTTAKAYASSPKYIDSYNNLLTAKLTQRVLTRIMLAEQKTTTAGGLTPEAFRKAAETHLSMSPDTPSSTAQEYFKELPDSVPPAVRKTLHSDAEMVAAVTAKINTLSGPAGGTKGASRDEDASSSSKKEAKEAVAIETSSDPTSGTKEAHDESTSSSSKKEAKETGVLTISVAQLKAMTIAAREEVQKYDADRIKASTFLFGDHCTIGAVVEPTTEQIHQNQKEFKQAAPPQRAKAAVIGAAASLALTGVAAAVLHFRFDKQVSLGITKTAGITLSSLGGAALLLGVIALIVYAQTKPSPAQQSAHDTDSNVRSSIRGPGQRTD